MQFRYGLILAVWIALLPGISHAQTLKVPAEYPTIQGAINAVLTGARPNGSVIEVSAGVYYEALLINSVPGSFTVRGIGPGATVVNAGGTGQPVLRIYKAPGALRFENMVFTGGTSGPGTGGGFTFEDTSPVLTNVTVEHNTGTDAAGGVLIRSHAQFANCLIRANTAARFGGGVVITAGSRPTFTNCQIRDNHAGTGGVGLGSIGSGGGVHANDASPTFRGCLITGNQAKFAGGGITIIGLYDSAYGPSRLLLEDTVVSNNIATRFSASDNPAEGGGINIEDNAVAYLIRSHVVANTANTGGGLNGYRARYEITSSRIEGNHAQDATGIGGFGGGISITSNNTAMPLRPAGSVLLVDSVVRNNDARGVAGIFVTGDQACASPTNTCDPGTAPRASLEIVNSLVVGNAAGVAVGGIRVDRTNASISGSHIIGNSAAASGQSYAGGMLMALGSNVTIHETTIAQNSSGNFGGGLFIDDNAVINMTNSRIYQNTSGSGGGIYVGNIGQPSGTIQSSTIADNSFYQIHEQACSPLTRTILNYTNNTITPRPGQTDLYFSTCGGATTSISTFNGFPRTTGNTSNAPSFVHFLSTPDAAPSVLSWSVSRASVVNISGVGSFNQHTGTVDVAPAAFSAYTLTSAGGPPAPATVSVTAFPRFGASSDTAVGGDFDGDGRRDLAVYRSATGEWIMWRSTAGFRSQQWGAFGDVPVPADYDGDGTTDIAVFRPSTGQWYILRSSGGWSVTSWGSSAYGDVPVPADYDGDSRADIAVYRGASGEWFVNKSTGGTTYLSWGAPSLGDVPVAADYDGDGRTDIGVYRTQTGQWFILGSSAGTISLTWGSPELRDSPVPADYDGDGKADIAVARATTGHWYVRKSLGGMISAHWGFGDVRLPGDFNGDGIDEIAIWQAASAAWIARQ